MVKLKKIPDIKRAAKKQIAPKELNIKNKYILFALIAGLISYLAYFLRFPNSYSIIAITAFVILLARNFRKTGGLKVIVCYLLFSAVIVPLFLFLSEISIIYKIAMLIINLGIIGLSAVGLKKMKIWGVYLSIAIFFLSIINLISSLLLINSTYLSSGLPAILFIANTILAMAFLILSMAYLIKSAKNFS